MLLHKNVRKCCPEAECQSFALFLHCLHWWTARGTCFLIHLVSWNGYMACGGQVTPMEVRVCSSLYALGIAVTAERTCRFTPLLYACTQLLSDLWSHSKLKESLTSLSVFHKPSASTGLRSSFRISKAGHLCSGHQTWSLLEMSCSAPVLGRQFLFQTVFTWDAAPFMHKDRNRWYPRQKNPNPPTKWIYGKVLNQAQVAKGMCSIFA